MEDTVKQFSEALCDVRKAHRLLFSYQEKMQSLVKFIASELGISTKIEGHKQFSNMITRRDVCNKWAWDFFPTFLYEYYLGDSELDDDSSVYISLIQYSDTGYFDAESNTPLNIESYAKESESQTKLMFFLEWVPKKCTPLWTTVEYTGSYVMNKEYASRNHKATVLYPEGEGKNAIVLYSLPMERFIDESSAKTALKEFNDYLLSTLDISIIPEE